MWRWFRPSHQTRRRAATRTAPCLVLQALPALTFSFFGQIVDGRVLRVGSACLLRPSVDRQLPGEPGGLLDGDLDLQSCRAERSHFARRPPRRVMPAVGPPSTCSDRPVRSRDQRATRSSASREVATPGGDPQQARTRKARRGAGAHRRRATGGGRSRAAGGSRRRSSLQPTRSHRRTGLPRPAQGWAP